MATEWLGKQPFHKQTSSYFTKKNYTWENLSTFIPKFRFQNSKRYIYFDKILEKLWYQLLKLYKKKEMMYITNKKMGCKGRKIPKLSKQES